MTLDEYNILSKHEDTMKTIIINRAISNIPIAYREDALSIARKKGYLSCDCQSGIFSATSRLYNEYIVMKNEQSKQCTNKRGVKNNKK